MLKGKTAILAVMVAAAVSVGVLVGASAAAAQYPARAMYHCPYGAFCIYPRVHKSPPGGRPPVRERPELGGVYSTYGYHNLRGQYGWHWVFNNQYGGGGVSFCRGYNGTRGQIQGMRSRSWGLIYMSPVNSVTLWLYSWGFDPEISCHM